MARNNTARAETVITMNGKAAETVIDALKGKAKQLRQEIEAASKAGDATKVKKLTAELNSTDGAVRKLRQETYDYNQVLKNLNGSSIKELEKAAKLLKNEIKGLSPASQDFFNKSKQLDTVRARLDALNGRVRESNSWFSRAGNTFNKYFGLATTAIATVTGLSFAFRGAAEAAAKMDDIYADVMKTTGLTRDEVVLLNEAFKKLNTRTSREQLNQLARDAGKLGISGRADVLAFVTAANKINVALREDLGEDAVLNIGKLSEIFQLTKTMGIEKSYASIGSAINALGQDSSASEQYLVDFAKRVAGAAYQAGLSFQNILGYASALDQSGAQVEMSATAFQNFLMKMYSETGTMAKIANMDLKSFANLLSTDVNSAIIAVLKGLKDQGGFAQMVPLFKEMGGEGARFVSVLSSLGTNIDMVTKAQDLSNIEFGRATSLQKEYNIKNETMQARLEKSKKGFQDQVIVLGEKLSPALLKTTNLTTLFLKLLMSTPKWVYAVIASGVAAIAIIKTWNVVMAVWNSLVAATKIATLAWNAALYLLEGRTLRAAVAWKQFYAALTMSGIGIAVAALATLAIGFYKLATLQTAATRAQSDANKEFAKASYQANALFDTLKHAEKGSTEYKMAMDQINTAYSPFLANMIDEKGNLNDIEAARKAVLVGLREEINLKIKNQAIEKIVSDSMDNQINLYDRFISSANTGSETVTRLRADVLTSMVREGKSLTEIMKKMAEYGLDKFQIPKKVILQYKEEYDQMVKDVNSIEKTINGLVGSTKTITPPGGGKPGGTNPDGTPPTPDNGKEKAFKKELDALEQHEREKNNVLKESYISGLIKQEEYEAQSKLNAITFLTSKLALHVQYGEDDSEVQSQYLDKMIKQEEDAYNAVQKILKKRADALQKAEKEKAKKAEAATLDTQIKSTKVTPLADDGKATEERLKHIQDLREKAEEIHQNFLKSSWKKEKEIEKKNLTAMLKDGLITQEEYEDEVWKMKLRYAVKIAEMVNSTVQSLADLYNTIRDNEFDALERQKERELSLYGDNADARAEIEQKYEKKKLALQIEYADKDMAVKIGQTIAAGALAIVQAFAQLGPLGGAIAAVIIGGTTALQIASIVAQRNALKANLSSSAQSDSSGTNRTVKGYHDGGYTGKHISDREEVGVVHANEWVAPAAMVRSNPMLFAKLERERVNRYYMSSPAKKFASGGYTSPKPGGTSPSQTDALLLRIIAMLEVIFDNPIPAYTVLDEMNAKQELRDKFKKIGSL